MYDTYIPELSAKLILDNIDQKKVIDDLYGYSIPIREHIFNIFRDEKDNNPGAWFEYYNNRLVIVDFADNLTNRADIIKLVGLYTKKSYNDVLLLLYNKYLLNKDLKIEKATKIITTNTQKIKKPINYIVDNFIDRDKEFWGIRDIKRQHLIDDKIYRCVYFEFYSNKLQRPIQIKIKPKELCYVFKHYISGAIKIYRPEIGKLYKFTTNATQEDIGLLQHIDFNTTYIVITKGYKECRELINNNFNSIYLMNEGVYPSRDVLWFLDYFDTIFLLMDNDYTGRIYSIKLKEYLSTLFPSVEIVIITLPFWNDLDLFYINQKQEAISFLEDNIIYTKL